MCIVIQSPCKGCKDRIAPTKENPQTCHGNCEKEAAYLEKTRYAREKKNQARLAYNDIVAVRSRTVKSAIKRKTKR